MSTLVLFGECFPSPSAQLTHAAAAFSIGSKGRQRGTTVSHGKRGKAPGACSESPTSEHLLKYKKNITYIYTKNAGGEAKPRGNSVAMLAVKTDLPGWVSHISGMFIS